MSSRHLELDYRLKPDFGPEELIQIIGLAIDEMGFDESALYDLMIEKHDQDRVSCETTQSGIAGRLNNETWQDVHSIILTSHWIKDMNLKLHLVRRSDHAVLTLKCEIEDDRRRERMAEEIEKLAAGLSPGGSSAETHDPERERLFGAMLLEPGVVQLARQSFLAGDFRKSLTVSSELLMSRLQKLLNVKPGNSKKIKELLSQAPPRIIFPDLSGMKLRRELEGLSGLITGCLTLLEPIIKGREPAPSDPAPVLKFLVLLSMIIERLEGGIPNPAAGSVSAGTGKKRAVSKTRVKAKSGRGRKLSRPVPAKAAAPKKAGGVRGSAKTGPGRIKKGSKRTGLKLKKTGKK